MPGKRKRRQSSTVCSEPGCPRLVTNGNLCSDHQREPWANARSRRPRLPGQSGWSEQKLHAEIMKLFGGMCHVCGRPGADEVDHVLPLAEGGTDTHSNLRPIHSEPCHREKTASESQKGKNRGP